MTDTEYDCLNRIRHAMKMYLRWEWDLSNEASLLVHDAMWFLCDRMWDELTARPVSLL